MRHQLQATTEKGRRLVALAEAHAAGFAGRAARHDSEGSFAFENLEELKASGYLYAPVPQAYGGLGVDSVHDVLVAASRLAEGDPSRTVGTNMHLVTMMSMARMHSIACNREDGTRAAATGAQMEEIVRSSSVIGAAVSEPDQDLLRQKTTAVREDAGWVLNGRKIISSMAPAATHFAVSVTYTDDRGEERFAYVIVPRETPGLTVHEDWDALGMRASGSVSITFDGCRVANGPGRGAPAGVITAEYLEQMLTSGPAHAAVSLGVAEAAHRLAADAVARKRDRDGDGAVRATTIQLAAENALDLGAARAMLGRSLALIDEHYAVHPHGYGSLEEAQAIFAEAQAAKAFANQAAVRIVDRAMTIVGGGAFMNAHPLSRLYRDARAGAFMHPLGANLAFEYVGAVALGISPQTF
jgi:alkylation response protein AidB-like acyl-CoA dehydrogenase